MVPAPASTGGWTSAPPVIRPTLLRSTALGLMFAVVRIVLGVWSLFVPALAEAGFTTLAWLLASFLVVIGVLGLAFAPARPGTPLTTSAANQRHGIARG